MVSGGQRLQKRTWTVTKTGYVATTRTRHQGLFRISKPTSCTTYDKIAGRSQLRPTGSTTLDRTSDRDVKRVPRDGSPTTLMEWRNAVNGALPWRRRGAEGGVAGADKANPP